MIEFCGSFALLVIRANLGQREWEQTRYGAALFLL